METLKLKYLIGALVLGVVIMSAGCGKDGSAPDQDKASQGKQEALKESVETSAANAKGHEAGSDITEISSTQQFDKILADNGVVVVQLYADWCGPCQMLKPRIKEIAKEYKGKITVAAVNVDNNREIAVKQGVKGIPDVRIFQNGKEKKKFVGLQGKKNYTDFIDSLLK